VVGGVRVTVDDKRRMASIGVQRRASVRASIQPGSGPAQSGNDWGSAPVRGAGSRYCGACAGAGARAAVVAAVVL
jgi:hypothetical protein